MKQNNANGRNIFLVPNADTLADLDFETWLPFADGHKRAQLQSMRKQAAHVSLVGILLAKYAIHTKWNIPIDQIRFGIGSHGKPYVVGYEQVHFNISHSDNILSLIHILSFCRMHNGDWQSSFLVLCQW